MLEKKSFNLAQPKRQDGWVSFQAWTRKWNRFFATIFCVLSFMLLFAIVVVNVVETEHEILPDKNEPLEELREYNIHFDVAFPDMDRLHHAAGGCDEIGTRITCQSMSIDDIDQALRTLIKPRLCTKFELLLIDIDFPTGNLSHGWMTIESCLVDVLEIVNSPTLRFIEDGVFDSRRFSELKKLYLTNVGITELRDNALKGLVRLEKLELRNLNELTSVTSKFLEPVNKLLTSLVVENVALTNPVNLTGVQTLNELMAIHFYLNYFNNSLNDETFRHLPHLTSLNLTGNNIQSLTSNVFDDIANTIRVIDLRGNRLYTMPEGIFAVIRSSVFRIYLVGNPWRCDCALVELKSFLTDPSTKNWFDSPLTCVWPLLYRYMEIIDAPFCRTTTPNPTLSTTESTTKEPMTTTTTPEEGMTTIEATAKPIECTICMETPHENINCSHPENRAAFYFHEDDEMISVRKRTLSFRIDPSDDGYVQILVSNPDKVKYVIFWFSDTESDAVHSQVTNEKVCAECTVTKENSYKITNLKSDSLYIFCLMKYYSKEISPFDCLPYKTGIIPLPISWFDRHDKFIAYTISILSLLLCSFIGAFIMYCIIRKMPTLLKGSERVIIVKDKEIIVMPNGNKKLSKTDSNLETSQERPIPNDCSAYLTPMPDLKPIYRKIHHRRASDTSLDSIRSYISTRAPPAGVHINSRTCCYSDFQGRCFMSLKDVPNTPPPLPQRRSFEQEVVDYASIAKTPDANIYTPFDYGTIVAVQTEIQNCGEMQQETHTVHI